MIYQLLMAMTTSRCGRPAYLPKCTIFENGPHGVGLANDDSALSEWSKLLANWLRSRGVVK